MFAVKQSDTAASKSATRSTTLQEGAVVPFFQAKLTVNQPGDPQEKEADAVAEQVMRMPENGRQTVNGNPTINIQRKSDSKEEDRELQRKEEEKEPEVQRKEEEPIQRKEEEEENPGMVQAKLGGNPMRPSPMFATQLHAMRPGGNPLPAPARQFMESRIGHDFSTVRVHTDARAAALSSDINARAFTHRDHIFFNTGQFAPESNAGQLLLAHELTHTIQQTGGKTLETTQAAATENETTASTPAQAVAPGPVVATTATPAQTGEKQAVATDPAAEGAAAPEPEAPAAPQKPEDDPEFQDVKKQVAQTALQQKDHVEPDVKVSGARKAALLPESEQSLQHDQDAHLGKMAQTKPQKEFSPEEFEKLLAAEIQRIENELPHSESDAKRFKREKPLEQVKQNIQGQVKGEKDKVAAPITAEASTPQPPATNLPTEHPEALTEEKSGKKPRGIDPKAAAPKPKADHEISTAKDSESLDTLMVEQDVTEEQFAESNEPKITKTLDLKKEAQAQAAAVPPKYREEEAKLLEEAQGKAGHKGHSKLGAMFTTRTNAFGTVFGGQTTAKTDDNTKQVDFKKELATIYTETKKDVTKILEDMSTNVQTYFEAGINEAKGNFEKRVESQLDDIHGWGVKDFFFGEDTEAIETVFRREKDIFLGKMRTTIKETAKLVAKGLNAAMARIAEGRTKATTAYGKLSVGQQKVVADAYAIFNSQFEDLEATVQDNKRELASSLADMYVQNVSTLRQTFDKLNEEARLNWIQKAARAIVEIATAIYKLGELIVKTLIRIASLVGDIIKHPIRFIESLATGIKDGVSNFIDRIDVHLKEAFFRWITGASANTGIQVPSKFDAKSLFGFGIQLLGLTYTNIRNLISLKFGEAKVVFIEKAIDAGEKGLEILTMIRKSSFAELWEHLKEYLGNQISEVFDQIKQTVLYTVVEKAIKWLAGLFMPAGAFFKAAMAIYAGLRWLADNINRIIDIVNAFLDSMELATKGQTAKIADKIEKILATGLILVIDFLAKLLNLGDLVKKVKSALDKLRRPIERAITWVLGKVKPVVDKLWKLGQKGKAWVQGKVDKTKAFVKDKAKKLLEWWKTRKNFKVENESHELYFEGKGEGAELTLASDPVHLGRWINQRKEVMSKSNKWGDKQKAAYKEIQELMKEMRTLTYDPQNSTGQKTHASIMNELVKQISIIGFLAKPPVPPLAVTPGFSDAKADGSIEVLYLYDDPNNHRPGEKSTGTHSLHGAFDELTKMGFRPGEWIRGHLINFNTGGLAVNSNLVPMPGAFNTGKYVKFEWAVWKIYEEKEVIWMSFHVTRAHANDPNGLFVSHLKASAGKMKPDANKQKWEPDLSTKVSPDISDTIDYPKLSVGTSINALITPPYSGNARDVGLANGLPISIIEALVKQGTPLGSVDDIKAFLENDVIENYLTKKDWTAARKARYLKDFEAAKKNNRITL